MSKSTTKPEEMQKTTLTKQQFLDKIPDGYQEALTQELLRGLNKTNLGYLKRSLNLLMKLAYKTQYKELSLQQIMDCVDIVEAYNNQ